jgi:hypothetical protein
MTFEIGGYVPLSVVINSKRNNLNIAVLWCYLISMKYQ